MPHALSASMEWLNDEEVERWILSSASGQTISRGGTANQRTAEDVRDLVGLATELGRVLGEGEPREIRVRMYDERTLVSRRRSDGTRLTVISAQGVDPLAIVESVRTS